MKRTIGKLITMLLCLTMLLSLMPMTTLAAETPQDKATDLEDIMGNLGNLPGLAATPTPADPTGACGVSMSWHLSGGVLTISGNGAMYDWNGSEHAPWYAYRGKIKSVVIEEGVPSIGSDAFDSLSNLTAVQLPESLERIGNRAFVGCTKLADITLPDGITEIGSAAFEGCTALTKVTLPTEIHKASDSLFKGCTSLTEVIFPKGETELGASAFEGCSSLEAVVWYQLTKIGTKAFSGCTKINVFNFPETLTEIGKDAFSGSGLKMVNLPKGITTIDFLSGADKLTAVFIPLSVKEIADGQFAQCKNLERIDYEGSKLDWKNIRIGSNNDMLQNAEFTYNRTETFLYAWVETTTVPVVTVTPAPTAAPTPTPVTTPDVTPSPVATPNPNLPGGDCGENAKWSFDEATNTLTISGTGNMADYYTEEGTDEYTEAPWYSYRGKVRAVVVEEGITSVGDYAFYNFQKNESVSLPEGLTEIGACAFVMHAITEAVIPDSVAQIGYSAFGHCDSLTSIQLPANLKAVSDSMFYGCSALKAVEIPEGVTVINTRAFYECTALESLSIPNTVKTIGDSVIYYCYALKALELPDSVTEIEPGAFDHSGIKSANVPEGITKINYHVFAGCDKLTEVTLPGSLIEISIEAFDDCDALTDIYYYGTEDMWDDVMVTKEGNDAILNATVHYLGTVATPEPTPVVTPAPTAAPTPTVAPTVAPTPTVKPELPGGDCGENAKWSFDESTGTLTISGEGDMQNFTQDTLGRAPWYLHREKITSLVVEEGITSIGNYAFSECSKLTSITLPDSMVKIGSRAFNYCGDLTAIEFPELVTEISHSAFFGCSALESVALPKNTTQLGAYLFSGCKNLKFCSIPYGVTEIGDYCFEYCGLEEISIPDSVTVIGHGAFMGNALEHLTVPGSVKEISSSAFSKNPLVSVTINEGTTDIKYGAFDATKLTEVRLPVSLTTIGDAAFDTDDIIKDVYYSGSAEQWKAIDIGKQGNVNLTNAENLHLNVAPTPTVNPNLPGGDCGENAKWSFDASTGTLTISGTGATEDYIYNTDGQSDTPWYYKRGEIKSIVVENGITSIGNGIFTNCARAVSVSLPDTLIEIGDGAFAYCQTLETIQLPNSVTAIGKNAFAACHALTDAALPKDLTVVSSGLFWNCYALPTVILPEGVTTIGDNAFYGCASLESLVIPDSVVQIGNNALVGGTTGIKYLSLPNGLETIDFLALVSTLEKIYIPASVKTIEANQFVGAENLTDVYYGGTEADWEKISVGHLNENLTEAAIHYNASGLPNGEVETPTPTPVVTPAPTAAPTPTVAPTVKPVTTPNPNLPNGKCGANATWEFNTADGTLTIRGEGAMSKDYRNEEGVLISGYSWNKYQSVIKKVVIEEGITHISDDAFNGCTGLKEVVMPESVTSIGDMVFYGCGVDKFTILPSLKVTNYFSVPGSIKNLYIYDLEQYIRLHSKELFFTDVTNLYLNDVLVTDLVIPEGTKTIPDSAFKSTSIETLTLPNSVTEIGESAFSGCEKLKKIKLNEGLAIISAQAFSGCKSLTSITIPASVEIINNYVFSNVKTVIFEGNAPLIAAKAFFGVKADAYYPAGNSTWTAEKMENYGGELNWIEGKPAATPTPTPTVKPTPTPDVTPNVTPGIDPIPTVKPTVKPTVTPKPAPPATPSPNPDLDPETCKHTLFFVAPQDATCTEDGFTGKVICGKGCGAVLQEGRVKPALGHKYKSGTCTRCGHMEGTPEVTPTPPVAGDTPFIDMTVNDWFYEPVRWAVAEGITSGTSENTFSPNMTCTRAQIVTFLWAAAGKPEPTSKSPFSDVKEGDWFYEPVIWAVENDITSGTTATTFSPNIPCSRAQVVALLYKAVGAPEVKTTDNPFTDVSESNYFHDAVLWALENGVASGVSTEKFGSSAPCTRAQIATFLYKAYNK